MKLTKKIFQYLNQLTEKQKSGKKTLFKIAGGLSTAVKHPASRCNNQNCRGLNLTLITDMQNSQRKYFNI